MLCAKRSAAGLERAARAVSAGVRRRYARDVPSPARLSPARALRLWLPCVCAVLAILSAATPAVTLAAGQLNPGSALGELAGGQPETPTATTSTTSTASSETETRSNSKTLILAALGAAVVLLVGIAFVIVRDARRLAPATDDDLIEATSGHDAAVRLARRRAKAKAARKQRKRTRR
jgi:hypothetical protein